MLEIVPVATPGSLGLSLLITRSLADWINGSGVRYLGWEGTSIQSFARIVQNPLERQGSLGG